jgi:hypothetical protein
LLILGAALRAADERPVEELVPAAAERSPDARGVIALPEPSAGGAAAELDGLAEDRVLSEPLGWLATEVSLREPLAPVLARSSLIEPHAAVSRAKLSGAMSHPRMIRSPSRGEVTRSFGAARDVR